MRLYPALGYEKIHDKATSKDRVAQVFQSPCKRSVIGGFHSQSKGAELSEKQTTIFTLGRDAAIEEAINGIAASIASFVDDPPDSQFQRGYLAGLWELLAALPLKPPAPSRCESE
jgi:hypothetical protein